jgi:hypothetical protein
LQTAQVQAQSGGTHRSAKLIESLKGAYNYLAQPLKIKQDFKHWVAKSQLLLLHLRHCSHVEQILFSSKAVNLLYSLCLVHLCIQSIEYKIQHGMKLATKQFQDQLRQPIRDGASKYEKVVYKCFYVAKCRLFSSLVSDLGEHTKHKFNNLLSHRCLFEFESHQPQQLKTFL